MNKKKVLTGILLFNLAFLTVSVSSVLGASTKIVIGDDPIDDILCCDDISVIQTWLENLDAENNTVDLEDFEELFERGFDFSARPDYIDVVEYGLETNGTDCWVYVEVQNINDLPTCNSFRFIMFMWYNDTFYNEIINFLAVYNNGTFNCSGGYCIARNQDGTWHTDNIGIDGNDYLFSYPCSWITEDDHEILDDQLSGMLISACYNASDYPTSVCVDVYPNWLWNDWIGEEEFFGADNATAAAGTAVNLTDLLNQIFNYLADNWVVLLLILVILALIIVIIVMVAKKPESKSKGKGKGRKVK